MKVGFWGKISFGLMIVGRLMVAIGDREITAEEWTAIWGSLAEPARQALNVRLKK